MVQNRQNVKVIGQFWAFVQSQFSRELYVQWSSNQAKNAFSDLKKIFLAFLTNLKNGPKSSKSSASLAFGQPLLFSPGFDFK